MDNRAFTFPRLFWLSAGLGCGVIILAGTWTLTRSSATPEWLRRMDELPRYPRPSNDLCLDADAHTIEWIEGELLRRPTWDVAEAEALIVIILKGYPKRMSDPDQTPAERSQGFVFRAATSAITTRLEFGAPITPAARRALIDLLVEELRAPFPERRMHAAADLVQFGEIEDRSVRAAVERLLDDPDPIVAEDVGFILTRYDDDRARRAMRAADRR
ncbi:MAG: hypothetical protein JNK58_02005 [Phycisphaerae bacterium]|nr:hypothetical protein [Phycisphaerae bacterium]